MFLLESRANIGAFSLEDSRAFWDHRHVSAKSDNSKARLASGATHLLVRFVSIYS